MSRPQFAVFGVPVRVEPVFFLVVGFFALDLPTVGLMVAWVAVVFVSILVHELGHALAFRRFGSGAAIVLWGLGGLTTGRAQPPRRGIVVSLAGPLTGLVLLGLPALWLDRRDAIDSPTGAEILDMVVFVNVAWSVVNLLPVLPLDGGNVARDLITLATGRPGERPARYLSIAAAAAAGAWAWVTWPEWYFPIIMAAVLVALNVSALRRSPAGSFVRVQAPPRPARQGAAGSPPRAAPGDVQRLLVEGHRALDQGNTTGAIQAGDAVLALRPYADIARMARELQAWAHLHDGDVAGAEAAVAAIPGGRKAGRYLRAAVRAAGDDPERGRLDLVEAFLFAGDGPDRARAVAFVAQRGLTADVARGLREAGSDGTQQLMLLERTLQDTGRLVEADTVRTVLLGD